MLKRLKSYLANDHHAVHLAGAQLALVLVLSAGLAIAAVPQHHARQLMTVRLAPTAAAVAQVQAVDTAPDVPVIRLQDMGPEQARKWNAANPIAKGANPAAKPFRLDTEGVLDETRAVDCMTAAIYYEAGFESTDGQRAVAQVVLNRMRHPAFPKTVCGVVFQGSDHKGGGCQFTFTCDGALTRGEPAEAAWARARKVAEAALAGSVMKKVGMATHYHAEYVAPYWSPTLVKVAVIGQHIFYRWTGTSGAPPAFGGHYAGGELGGLKMATLDSLGKSQTKASILSASDTTMSTNVSASAPQTPAPTKIAIAEKPADMVTAQTATKDAAEIVKPEDLDWAGRPKSKIAPRVAMPGGAGARAY